MAGKSGMHVVEESSGGIVPAKCPNKSVRPQAEGMEGRLLAKENTLQQPCSGHSARIDRCAGCGACGRESQRFSSTPWVRGGNRMRYVAAAIMWRSSAGRSGELRHRKLSAT